MSSSRANFSVIPDVPRQERFIQNNDINYKWYLFFDQLVLALQTFLTSEGFVMPSQTATDISTYLTNSPNGTILYDSTNNAFKGRVAGSWVTFVTI